MDDSQRLVEALKFSGNKLPNFEYDRENYIQKFLKNMQFSGGGGGSKDSGGVFGGGRLAYELPLNKTSSITPYLEGYLGKPINQPITGGLTGLGLMYKQKF